MTPRWLRPLRTALQWWKHRKYGKGGYIGPPKDYKDGITMGYTPGEYLLMRHNGEWRVFKVPNTGGGAYYVGTLPGEDEDDD